MPLCQLRNRIFRRFAAKLKLVYTPPHRVETLRFDRSLKGTPLQGMCHSFAGRLQRTRTGTEADRPGFRLRPLLSPHHQTHRHSVHFRSWRCPRPSDLPTGVLSTLVVGTVR